MKTAIMKQIDNKDQTVLLMKGASEVLLERCSFI